MVGVRPRVQGVASRFSLGPVSRPLLLRGVDLVNGVTVTNLFGDEHRMIDVVVLTISLHTTDPDLASIAVEIKWSGHKPTTTRSTVHSPFVDQAVLACLDRVRAADHSSGRAIDWHLTKIRDAIAQFGPETR